MNTPWQLDIGKGLFETLLVVDGAPVEMEAHLQRLARSLRALYLLGLPNDTEDRLRAAAAGLRRGRLRLTATPPSEFHGLPDELIAEVAIDTAEVDPGITFPRQGICLRTHPIPGGLGSHKWVHRPGIDRPSSEDAGPLLVDEGEVLEAGWANVFAVRGGTLFTPPLDGRILPGVTRATTIELALERGIEVAEETLSLEDLRRADEAFLTNSIRGIESVEAVDGVPLSAGEGALTRRLGRALRDRWGLAPDAVQTA